jgi:hypothetical protein
MDNVGCTGTEQSLMDCPHSRHHSCIRSHRDDAAVQCQTSMLNNCDSTDMQCVTVSIIKITQGSFAMTVMLGL